MTTPLMGKDVLADDSSKAIKDVAEDVGVAADADEVEDVEDRDALVGEAPTWPTST
mgnify:CR=1 FL=1